MMAAFVSPGFAQTPAEAVDAYASIYQTKIDDPLAVYFTPDAFGIPTDGSADVSDALQQAINRVQETVRYGIVFIPEGTYRISRTIHLWKGIRLIGYGNKRPVIRLGKHTDGFQEGEGKYLFHFCSDRPAREPARIQDANAGTFYSGIRNIDLVIEEGNPAAVGVRFHAAQHCFLSHIDFRLSAGATGVEDLCNEIEYCRFFGGDYAIRTRKTAPGWQALVLDSHFEKQAKAAICTEEVGLMLIRDSFKDLPTVVSINPERSEALWMSDCKLENISRPALIVSNEHNPKTQINLENIACIRVPDFLRFRTSGETIRGEGRTYRVATLTHGLQYGERGERPTIRTTHRMAPAGSASIPPSDVPLLPPTRQWVNLKTLGAKGDGLTDDTEVLKKAIREHATIYLPGGHYRVTESIVLQPHTNLVGLHPSITQIVLRDSTTAFQGLGTPLPLLEAPQGGVNIVSGIGLNTSGVNPRAVAAKWMAGSRSMMNDVRFTGGHGTYGLNGREVRTYNDNRTADGIPYRKWDTQYWSLWITDGGGGTFKDIWTPSPYAAAGLFISQTATEGRIYGLSSEHHVRNEVVLDGVANWKIYGLQLEEESGEGPYCLPLDISNSQNILLANTFSYRVSRVTTPYPQAIRTAASTGLLFCGLRAWTWTKYLFDNTLFDATSRQHIRPHEIALLRIDEQPPAPPENTATVEKLAGGFDFIDGATVDAEGNVYFVDARWNRIYCWDVTSDRLRTICDLPIHPTSLAFDTQGNLLVVTRYIRQATAFERGEIRVVSIDPKNPVATLTELPETPFAGQAPQSVVYQTSRYRIEHRSAEEITRPPQTCFVAPDGLTLIPNTADVGYTFALKAARPGDSVYVSSSAAQQTFVCRVDADGRLTAPRLFAEEGEADVLADGDNVYLSSGHIQVYDRAGSYRATLPVPERPTALVLAGPSRDTLYICARSSLYRIPLKRP
jgi:sugar lactone lactonase YvrE